MKKIWRLTILISIAVVLAILYWYFYIYNPTDNIAYWPNWQIRHIYHESYWRLNWEQIDYYENGQIYRIMHFKNGQQHWEYISYYENGQIADIRHFDHSESVGELISYRPTWELIWKWNYVDWLPVDWEYIERYENWDIRRKVTYKDWKVDWYDIRYDRNGDISFKYDADRNTVYNKYDADKDTVEEPGESIENNEDVTLCNDIDIDWNAEIINIDDVVENCTYEEWTAYSWNDWWCWWVMPHLYITKDIIWYFDIVADEDHPIICKSPRAWIIKSLSGDFEDLATFWYKRGISKKSLIDVLEARTEEEVFQNGCWFYFCNGDICNQFYRPSYWENEHHYYIYWYRYPKEFPYETVVLVDDKLYNIWSNETMFDDSYWPNPMKQWKWVVYWLDWDKLIVKRYVDWELISPYTLENFNSYNFDEKKTTTKFKVKTCEIPL